MNTFTEFLDEKRIRKIKVPKFKDSSSAQSFMDKLGPDDLPASDVLDPETGEFYFIKGDKSFSTKRAAGKASAKRDREDDEEYGPDEPYFSFSKRDSYREEREFEKFYGVVKKDLSKMLGKAESKRMMDADYDVYVDIPRAISRKDGKPFTDNDKENINNYLTWWTENITGNIMLKAFIKVGKTRRVIIDPMFT